MQNNDNHIDKIFRDKLSGYSIEPPPAVWDRVSESLGHKKTKRRAMWLWTMSGAASLLLAFISGWYISNQQQNKLFNDDLAQLKSEASTQIIIQSPVEADIQIVFPKTEPKTLLGEQILVEERQLYTLPEPVIESPRQVFDDVFMLPKAAFASTYKPRQKLELIQTEEALNAADKAIIEANLLAMNNTNKSNDKQGAWSVGVSGSPVFRADQPELARAYSPAPDYNMMLNSVSTQYKTNFTGGISLEYETSNRLAFVTGLNYNEIAQEAGGIGVSFVGHNWVQEQLGADYMYSASRNETLANDVSNNALIHTKTGVANMQMAPGASLASVSAENTSFNRAAQNYDYNQSAAYVEIPMLMRYRILDKLVGVHLLGGLNTNILISNNAELSNQSEVIARGTVDGLSPVAFSSSMGMGINYKIIDQLSFNIEPTLKLYLNPLNSNYQYGSRPYSVGVYSGIKYNF